MNDLRLATVDRFAAASRDDPLVLAAFLGGSFAAGTADAHSDLDLYVITEDTDYDDFFLRREEFVAEWLDPVLLETTIDFEGFGFDMVHFVGADGVSGELAMARRSNYSSMHGGPHRVLVDTTGLLEGVTFTNVPPDREQTRMAVSSSLRWFWLHATVLGKSLARGRTLDAARALGQMRDQLVALIWSLPGPLTAEDREALAATYVPAADGDITQAARTLIDLHRRLGAQAATELEIVYPTAAADLITAKLAPAQPSRP